MPSSDRRETTSFAGIAPHGDCPVTAGAVHRRPSRTAHRCAVFTLPGPRSTTGQLVSGFNHTLNAQTMVIQASPDGSQIYVSGDFTEVDGQVRKRIAAFDSGSGALIDSFKCNVGYQVRAIAATNSTLYIGGTFGGVVRTTLLP